MSSSADASHRDMALRARQALDQARRKRDAFSDCAIPVGDPGWEILLGLAAANAQRNPVSLTELIRLTGLGELEMRRYLAMLCEAQLALHQESPKRTEAPHFGITRKGNARLASLLSTVCTPAAIVAHNRQG